MDEPLWVLNVGWHLAHVLKEDFLTRCGRKLVATRRILLAKKPDAGMCCCVCSDSIKTETIKVATNH